MILDLQTSVDSPNQPADVCIIGAGAAGILLAKELSLRGKSVTLLESGGLQEEAATADLYRGRIIGLPHKGIHEGRHRVYGGSTTRWGGQLLELFEEDFNPRHWIEGSGWPFPKKELLSYYQRALSLEGIGGATHNDADVWREIGLDYPDSGDCLIPFFSRWCREPNFSYLLSDVLKHNENLRVWLHANATELLVDQDSETICGVKCRTLTGREAVFKAKNYILCLGGIETVRFLMQPHARGKASWLQNQLLGCHYQDHLDAYCGEIQPMDTSLFHQAFDNIWSRGYRYEPRFRLFPEELARERLLSVGGMVFFEDKHGSQRHEDWQIIKNLMKGRPNQVTSKDVIRLIRVFPIQLRQMARYQFQKRSYNPHDLVRFRLRVFCEQEPLGRSRITLDNSQDSLGSYRIRLDWRISDLELKTIRHFVDRVAHSLEAQGLARVTPDKDLMERPEDFIPKIMDSYHHMGGTRMALSPSQGVVDDQLKIHGTKNAYVCSSSVFPSSGFSNPTHTLLALSVRLADHLNRFQ